MARPRSFGAARRALATAVTTAAVTAGTIAVATEPAAASSLSCGPAYLTNTRPWRSDGYIVQSCTGEGTVMYTLHCLPFDAQFTYYFPEPGASIRYRVWCPGGGIPYGVSWDYA
jgi:hypothetical protein